MVEDETLDLVFNWKIQSRESVVWIQATR